MTLLCLQYPYFYTGILTSRNSCAILVGVRGLEPPTSASGTLRASRLRYTPVGQSVQVIHHRPYPTQIGLYSLSASLARHCCQAIPNTSPTEGKYNIIGQALTMGEKCITVQFFCCFKLQFKI